MDFDAAINVHAGWKLKIFNAARNVSNQKLDPLEVGKDNLCTLGQWIHGEGKALMEGRPEYLELVRLHADFHRQAALLVSLIDKGKLQEAEEAVNDRSSPYGIASSNIIGLLMKMKGSR